MLVVALATPAGVVSAILRSNAGTLISHQALIPFITVGFAVLGALIAARRPDSAIGWLFLATAEIYAFTLLAVVVGRIAVESSTLGLLAHWFDSWLWLPGLVLPTVFVFLLFPDGSAQSPARRALTATAAVGLAAITLAIGFHQGPLGTPDGASNLLGSVGLEPFLTAAAYLGTVLLVVCALGSMATLLARLRRARDEHRQQLKWLAYAAVLSVLGFGLSALVHYLPVDAAIYRELSIAISELGVLTVAMAATIAIVRHRLYDIDLIVNRTLVYGALSTLVVAFYILAVGGLSALFREQTLAVGLLASGVVAALFQPARQRLQRLVDHRVYGHRDRPADMLNLLGQRLEGATEPERMLPTLVETVAQALRLPYARLSLEASDEAPPAAEVGRRPSVTFGFPLVHQGERIGELRVAPGEPGGSFAPSEHALLEALAAQAGAALRSARLTLALRRSHQHLVASREEERRRLRRDLHDGLGPALASLTLKLDLAHNVLARDPEAVEEVLSERKAQLHDLNADVRRLVYGLRPPVLDALGLRDALREQARQHEHGGLRVSLPTPTELSPLPAAVEVAAYRIVQEALTNVVRHSKARACLVTVATTHGNAFAGASQPGGVGWALSVVIEDDGNGMPPSPRLGVGITSMRERALELGGRFSVDSRARGGTVVSACLPLIEEQWTSPSAS